MASINNRDVRHCSKQINQFSPYLDLQLPIQAHRKTDRSATFNSANHSFGL